MRDKDRKGFLIGERVVYPTSGVGVISDIQEQVIQGEARKYYVIAIPSLDMNILLPVATATDMGLRKLSTKKDTEAALSMLSEKKDLSVSDWKARQVIQAQMLKSGTISNVATIVNILYNRQKTRDLPVQERRLYENALTHLVDETCFVLGMNTEQAKRTIFKRLEKIK
ncbi:MAG TPA: CarD family transcriptional regulator [Candidatus Ornithospirochaeta avicola]|uniref:CarD family transcriptional regulator n=1 Tax=Candidatus Ornithospirochaeta avicola TaxID=2840896 RepID=A0A9D1TMX8_9SPIO|nr:CarD family transcriptional regulator [Candidatus Ornithospirochaeta avicola]